MLVCVSDDKEYSVASFFGLKSLVKMAAKSTLFSDLLTLDSSVYKDVVCLLTWIFRFTISFVLFWILFCALLSVLKFEFIAEYPRSHSTFTVYGGCWHDSQRRITRNAAKRVRYFMLSPQIRYEIPEPVLAYRKNEILGTHQFFWYSLFFIHVIFYF